jgi:hypothetical protein
MVEASGRDHGTVGRGLSALRPHHHVCLIYGSEAGAEAPAPGPVATTPARRRQVLVIDDEPMVGRSLTRVLSERHDVDALTSARQAPGAATDQVTVTVEQFANGDDAPLVPPGDPRHGPQLAGYDRPQRDGEGPVSYV